MPPTASRSTWRGSGREGKIFTNLTIVLGDPWNAATHTPIYYDHLRMAPEVGESYDKIARRNKITVNVVR